MLSAKKSLHYINELREITSTNGKEQYLKEIFKEAPEFKEILKYTYSSLYQYQIKSLPNIIKFKIKAKDNYIDILKLHLNPDIEAKDKKANTIIMLQKSTKSNYKLLQLILDRNIRTGTTTKTINKVLGYEFIKQFKPMKPRGTYTTDKLPLVADFKFNGQRTVIEKVGGNIQFFSPSGKVYDIPIIREQLDLLLAEKDNVRLDCEIDGIPSAFGLTDKEFADDKVRLITNGWMNSVYASADKTLRDVDKVSKLRLSIFDIVNIEEAYQQKKGANGAKLEDRLTELDGIFEGLKFNNLYYKKPLLVKTGDEVAYLFYSIILKKGEGLICKSLNSLYHSGDSQEWCKIKNQATCDLEILDYKLGGARTKNAGKVTSIICGTSCRELIVTVGSGFKDEDIANLEDESYREWLIGKTIELTFTNIIQSGGKYSLFLPRLKNGSIDCTNLEASLRPDKLVADKIKDVQIAETQYARDMMSNAELKKVVAGKSKIASKIDRHIENLLKG